MCQRRTSFGTNRYAIDPVSILLGATSLSSDCVGRTTNVVRPHLPLVGAAGIYDCEVSRQIRVEIRRGVDAVDSVNDVTLLVYATALRRAHKLGSATRCGIRRLKDLENLALRRLSLGCGGW